MGALGFDDLKELLKFRGGNNAALDSAGASSLNYYGIWINSAYRQLCTQDKVLGLKKNLYFPQLMTSTTKTTTDGQAYITTPTDAIYIKDIYDTTNNAGLSWIPWKKYVDYTDRTTASSEGDPKEWTRYSTSIYLHPTPDATMTMTVYYKKLVADLTGTQTTDIGAEWDDVILELAAYKMFTWIHEYDKAKFVKETFLEMATGLADIYGEEEKDTDENWGPSAAYLPPRARR